MAKKNFSNQIKSAKNAPAKAAKVVENADKLHGTTATQIVSAEELLKNKELQAELEKALAELEKAKEKLKYRRGRTLELYARKTYLVRKDLVSRVEDIARYTERSLKDVIEEALEIVAEKYQEAPVLPDYMRKGKKVNK